MTFVIAVHHRGIGGTFISASPGTAVHEAQNAIAKPGVLAHKPGGFAARQPCLIKAKTDFALFQQNQCCSGRWAQADFVNPGRATWAERSFATLGRQARSLLRCSTWSEDEGNIMAVTGQQRDATDSTNTVAALGLRRAALRGMLGSPIIDADDQKGLRDELMGELRSIGQSMARAPAKNTVELCAKLDVLGEEFRPEVDAGAIRDLIASIRRDVISLTTRPPMERSPFQSIRTLQNRAAETAAETARTSGTDSTDETSTSAD
jgi:hypothetical protein